MKWITCLALIAFLAVENVHVERYQRRWVYAQYNLLVDKNVEQVLDLIARAQKSGFNGMVLADYKFNVLERLPDRYFKNVARVQKAAAAASIELIPTVCPIGYSAGLLAHDPNLAEGVPVKQAPFEVRKGVAVPLSDVRLRNGDLEEAKGDRFPGFTLQDSPGKGSFADRNVAHGGSISCRVEDPGSHHEAGNCRLAQRVTVRPFACYRLSAWIKTLDLKPAGFRLLALGKVGRTLTWFSTPVAATQDWKRVEVVFNSVDNTDITVYAGIWTGKSGKLWIDDFQIEELSLVNVVRRNGCPFIVTSEDGQTVYDEGKDFEPVRDEKLGVLPYAGEYSFDRPAVPLRLASGSRIQEGQKLRVSWYHPIIIHTEQVACCLSELKVYDVLRDQVKRVHELLRPKTFFMSHDELRVANWCQACRDRKLTPGELLADNVRRCVQIIKEFSPDAEIVVWSDMFDPQHNAVENYYLVNGPLTGSWNGLPARVMIANWNGGKAAESLKWFGERGHQQIIAGYYDSGIDNFRRWNAAAKSEPSATGFMYTTWEHRYDDLEAYGKALRESE